MKTGPKGLEIIKEWEGLRLKAYPDPATGGEPWTIGYGLTSAAGIVPVKRGMVITKEQAEDYLIRALAKYEYAVSRALKRTPTQNQFDAMVSLCYNIGPGAFTTSSVAKHFNTGNLDMAAMSFLLWVKANYRTMEGLKRRREAERKLFLSDDVVAPLPDGDPGLPEDPIPQKPRGLLAALIDLFLAIFKRKA
jgi:lysozyme